MTAKEPLRRANDLDGRQWTRSSISVWDDVRLSKEERALKHPAMFPAALAERLIECFTTSRQTRFLDPFCGSGSTLVAAAKLGRAGIGCDIYGEYLELTASRLTEVDSVVPAELHRVDARRLDTVIPAESVDLCITSPPYWDILNQKRTADRKQTRSYGESRDDLGEIAEYQDFLDELQAVFASVFTVLKPQSYCIVNVMDLRKKSSFFPLHSDLAERMQTVGFLWDDLIVWDRRAEYNNLRPLGFPYVFRINKVHEFLLIMQKRRTD